MNSSQPRAEHVPPAGPAVQLVAEGGIGRPPAAPDDPFAALDDLMAVVEALCPHWPERPVFKGTDLRL